MGKKYCNIRMGVFTMGVGKMINKMVKVFMSTFSEVKE
jgi:hypothetical protein